MNIHAFEPEYINCKKIEEKQDHWKPHIITVHQTALWDNSQMEMCFEENGLSGKVENDGENLVKLCTIDECELGKVSFIKLDIEGAERQALKGALKTIKRDKPILAICAYHLQDDILALSDFIKDLDCNYKIVLRHYMNSSGDTILYGIPV